MLVTLRTCLTTGRSTTLTFRGTTGMVSRMSFPATLTDPLGTHGHITDIASTPFTGPGFPFISTTAPGFLLITLTNSGIIGRTGRAGRTRVTCRPGIPILRTTLRTGPGHGSAITAKSGATATLKMAENLLEPDKLEPTGQEP